MRVISANFNFFYGAILLPFKNCPINIRISLAEFELDRRYKHLKVAHAHNLCHFEFFYGAILWPFKKCPMNILIRLIEFYVKTEVISFRNLYMIKVQKSKLIKIIDDGNRP